MLRAAIFIATVGYTGYFPVAPGTIGSAVGLIVYVAVRAADSWIAEAGAIVLLGALGVWAGTIAESFFGGIDPGPVVIDEVVGMLITVAFVPVTLAGAIAAFFIFRVFDVIKPYPAGRLEHLPGGIGVMADDAMAAVYGNITLRLLLLVFPGLAA